MSSPERWKKGCKESIPTSQQELYPLQSALPTTPPVSLWPLVTLEDTPLFYQKGCLISTTAEKRKNNPGGAGGETSHLENTERFAGFHRVPQEDTFKS